jgi:hypothetical protein
VHRDPSFDFDTYRAHLFLVDPDSTVDWQSLAIEIEFFQGYDDGLFKIAHPTVEVFAVFGNIKNRVGNQLTRAVVRDIAAAVGFEDLNSLVSVPLGGVEEIFGVEARPERENRVVFEKEQRVFGCAVLHLGKDFKLLLKGFLIRDSTEVEHLQQFSVAKADVECSNLFELSTAKVSSLTQIAVRKSHRSKRQ